MNNEKLSLILRVTTVALLVIISVLLILLYFNSSSKNAKQNNSEEEIIVAQQTDPIKEHFAPDARLNFIGIGDKTGSKGSVAMGDDGSKTKIYIAVYAETHPTYSAYIQAGECQEGKLSEVYYKLGDIAGDEKELVKVLDVSREEFFKKYPFSVVLTEKGNDQQLICGLVA